MEFEKKAKNHDAKSISTLPLPTHEGLRHLGPLKDLWLLTRLVKE